MRRTLTVTAMVVALALTTMAGAFAKVTASGNAANSLGKTTLGTDVYSSSVDEMNYGDGIPNGNWITAESQGVVIGLRATDRKDGPLPDVTGTNGNRVGIYEATTGGDFDGADAEFADWNYEFSVDLTKATGNAEGKTIADYSLALEQDFTEQDLYGALGTDPVQLPMPAVCYTNVEQTVCQQSWNPVFGNDDFDLDATVTYTFRLILTPETFNGPPLAVKMQVNVTADNA